LTYFFSSQITGSELGCSCSVTSSCPTSGTRQVSRQNPRVSFEWKKGKCGNILIFLRLLNKLIPRSLRWISLRKVWRYQRCKLIYLSGILGGKGCLFSDDVSNGSETHYYKYVLSELTENGKSHMKERQHPKKEHWRYACVKVILKRDISKVACNVSKWVVCPSIYEFCLHLWYLQTFTMQILYINTILHAEIWSKRVFPSMLLWRLNKQC
jgi:hypothetical protein